MIFPQHRLAAKGLYLPKLKFTDISQHQAFCRACRAVFTKEMLPARISAEAEHYQQQQPDNQLLHAMKFQNVSCVKRMLSSMIR